MKKLIIPFSYAAIFIIGCNTGSNTLSSNSLTNTANEVRLAYTNNTCVVWDSGKCKTDKTKLQNAFDEVYRSINISKSTYKYETSTNNISQKKISEFIIQNEANESRDVARDLVQTFIPKVQNSNGFRQLLYSVCNELKNGKCSYIIGPAKSPARALAKASFNKKNLSKVFDYQRASILVDYSGISPLITQLSLRKDYKIVVLKDRISNPTNEGYRDIQLFIEDKNSGFISEIQLLASNMSAMKNDLHSDYETIRVAQDDLKRISANIENANSAINIARVSPFSSPEGIKRIEDYRNDLLSLKEDLINRIEDASNNSLKGYTNAFRNDAITACFENDRAMCKNELTSALLLVK